VTQRPRAKYTIEGFSQADAVRLGLDATDIVLLRWFVDFAGTGEMESVQQRAQGKVRTFYWVSYPYVLECLPILGIGTERGLRNRLSKLCEAGVLIRHTVRHERGTRAYYAFGKKYGMLLRPAQQGDTEPTGKPVPVGGKSRSGGHRNGSSGDSSVSVNSSVSDRPQRPAPPDLFAQPPPELRGYSEVVVVYRDSKEKTRTAFMERLRGAPEQARRAALQQLEDQLSRGAEVTKNLAGYMEPILEACEARCKQAAADEQEARADARQAAERRATAFSRVRQAILKETHWTETGFNKALKQHPEWRTLNPAFWRGPDDRLCGELPEAVRKAYPRAWKQRQPVPE